MDIFEACVLGAFHCRNRILRAATWEGLADEQGHVTERLEQHIAEVAAGGVGGILSSIATVSPEGRARARQVAASGPDCLPGLARMAAAAHGHGVGILLQLAHAGAAAEALDPLAHPPLGPNAEAGCTAVNRAGMDRLIEAYVSAALLAKEAGFDGVQVHMAHYYLLNSFLSPLRNQRQDAYGGDFAGRTRFPLEVTRAVRAAVGQDWPVWVKLCHESHVPGGTTRQDMAAFAKELSANGVSAVELRSGYQAALPAEAECPKEKQTVSLNAWKTLYTAAPKGKALPEQEMRGHLADAAALKAAVSLPLITVGGLRSPEMIKELLDSGNIEAVSLCRPLIREPGMVKRWSRGDTHPSTCISCLACWKPALAGEGIRCPRA